MSVDECSVAILTVCRLSLILKHHRGTVYCQHLQAIHSSFPLLIMIFIVCVTRGLVKADHQFCSYMANTKNHLYLLTYYSCTRFTVPLVVKADHQLCSYMANTKILVPTYYSCTRFTTTYKILYR